MLLQMSFERFTTNITSVRSGSPMNCSNMLIHTFKSVELFAASHAHKLFDAFVSIGVGSQHVVGREGEVTLATLVGLITGMNTGMLNYLTSAGKRHIALWTRVRFLASMNAHVKPKSILDGKLLLANIAPKPFVSSVDGLVASQSSDLDESCAACFTLVGPVSGVEVDVLSSIGTTLGGFRTNPTLEHFVADTDIGAILIAVHGVFYHFDEMVIVRNGWSWGI